MTKYYGVFKFTAKSWQHKEDLLWRIYNTFIKNTKPFQLVAMNKTQLANSRDDSGLKLYLQSWKDKYREERKTSLCHTYSTKYLIHECDENGIWKPTKKELKEAEEMWENFD